MRETKCQSQIERENEKMRMRGERRKEGKEGELKYGMIKYNHTA